MNSKALATLAVAGLVLLAGCSIPSFGGNDKQSPATPTPTADGDYPTGVSADGVNASTLANAHLSHLSSQKSYTVKVERELSQGNKTFAITSTTKVEMTKTGTAYLSVIEQKNGNQSRSTYAGAEMSSAYSKRVATDGTIYSKHNRDPNSRLANVPSIQTLLSAGDYNVKQTKAGVKISVTGLTGKTVAREVGLQNLKSGKVTAVVSDKGYLKSYQYTVTSKKGVTLTTSVKFKNIGSTSVSKPKWVSTAKDKAAVGSLSVEQGANYVTFNYKQGATLEAGTRAMVTIGPQFKQAQIQKALEPGNTYYMYLKDGQVKFSSIKPGNPDKLPNDSSVSVLFIKNGVQYLQMEVRLGGSDSGGSGNSTSDGS